LQLNGGQVTFTSDTLSLNIIELVAYLAWYNVLWWTQTGFGLDGGLVGS